MTDRKIVKMLEEIVQEVDYDIYYQLFKEPEEPDLAGEQIEHLISLVRQHIK